MKTNRPNLIALTMATAVVVVCAGCSTTPPPPAERTTATSLGEGVPGGTRVDTFEITARVTAVDRPNRMVTLLTPDGEYTKCQAGPDVLNLDRIKTGDTVKATVTEEMIVFVREKSGMRNNDGQAGLVALAPKGSTPGAVMTGTSEVTTRVKAVDLQNHKATLEFPDGRTKRVAVRPDVKLSAADVGREVVIRVTHVVALLVEKP